MTEGLFRIILTSKDDLSIRSIPTNALNCQMLIYDAMRTDTEDENASQTSGLGAFIKKFKY